MPGLRPASREPFAIDPSPLRHHSSNQRHAEHGHRSNLQAGQQRLPGRELRLAYEGLQGAHQQRARRAALQTAQLLLPGAQRLDHVLNLVGVDRFGVELRPHPMRDGRTEPLKRVGLGEHAEVRHLGAPQRDIELQLEPDIRVVQRQHPGDIGHDRLDNPGNLELHLLAEADRAAHIDM